MIKFSHLNEIYKTKSLNELIIIKFKKTNIKNSFF